MLSLPNILTLSRIVAIPGLAALLWWPGWHTGYLIAFFVYCLMGITDYFDGYLARSSGAVSKLGIFLDPIADKIMVAAVILVLTAQGILRGPYVGDMHVIAGLIILIREIAVSGLREFLGGLQVSMPVSRLAKWKTTFQLISLGALILGNGLPGWNMEVGALLINVPHTVGLATLWGAAVLTLITGWDYLRVGLRHMD
ncbi:CDP-diacylglycerol--glycerol-3-phosphate 3-phosphatidyltransferase [Novosphingobium marinum]|uniref:CDP-diacylglycerol--glycerol-3-phosphate 3-phosphatidyltransferase n=1 Tax=Novosphingobium marinum TaxID=1514948 RepID=A0A7Z0BWY6_9SPHN|nr:CDP-diacylglycerol--glycerol-3-phosphate 3-phosphatidyltransferase [Novosphingobium marinum]NYH96890.1 CDP-diacylglycerol--glycerol-3-phosphate 3-phosphatidyltransferase/cardiolipin synthase [Novosphingobium marinum]GGC41572.1 CDP-diacylglycerol--glycerol-3-phosphate 3-phosphatidyltransferase [Novosphingobium marinum]